MKNIIKVIFFCILAFCSFAEDIKIIELHNQSIDQILLDATKNDSNSINTEELETTSDSNKSYLNKELFPDDNPTEDEVDEFIDPESMPCSSSSTLVKYPLIFSSLSKDKDK